MGGESGVAGIDVRRSWRAREVPDGDLVVFGDGRLVVMEFIGFTSGEIQWWPILRAVVWEPENWIDVDGVLARAEYEDAKAESGESSAHGSIGWVALTGADGALEWLAVSRYSDPFASLTLDGSSVTATSTSGRVWEFPRDAPHQVKIT